MGKVELKEAPITIRYNGLFDFDGLYAAITNWAKNYGFLWHEKTYKHKVFSSSSAEEELSWVMTNEVTEYIKYEIAIEVHTWDQKDVEVEANGQKKTVTSARIMMTIKSTIYTDWQKRFGSGRFAGLLGKWYEKLLTPVESVYYDQLYYRTWNLHALIKKYFDMQKDRFAYKGYLKED